MSKYELKPRAKETTEQELTDLTKRVFDLVYRVSNLEADNKVVFDNIMFVLGKIQKDLEDRRQLRAKQVEVIDRLNQYLKDWV